VDGYYAASDGGGQEGLSLGHVNYPILRRWNGGGLAWTARQASEWQQRFMTANGAWTWSVRRGTAWERSVIDSDDLAFLRSVYEMIDAGVEKPWQYECDWSPSAAPTVTLVPT